MEDRRLRLVRRSLLYMPAHVPRFVESAWRRGADAVILDLEDSVPPAEKGRARSLVRGAIPLAARGGSDVFVRVNNRPGMLPEDLDASIWPGLAGVAFPKPEGADEVRRLDEAIGRLERERGLSPGSVEVYTGIESAAAFLRAREIALATPRLSHIAISSEDLPRDLGVEPTVGGEEILLAKQYLIFVAREAGAQPLGLMGTMTRFDDLEGLRESARRACRQGYMGSTCIHPAQVPVLNEEFSPKEDQVARARRIVEAYEEAESKGLGAVAVEGLMVDLPVAERARRLLRRAELIRAREEAKRLARERAGGGGS